MGGVVLETEDHRRGGAEMSECHFCGSSGGWVCRSTRDMVDRGLDDFHVCFAALMMHGGGEYTEDRLLSAELMRRAGLKRETGS